jgi:hypothetical protein
MTDIMPNHETFAIVPVFDNKPPSDAIVWGSISEVMEYIRGTQSRAEAEERIASAREQLKTDAKTLQKAQQITAQAIPRLTALGDALVAAHEKRIRKDAEAKRVAAEQAEARRVQEMLDRLPDPDRPDDGELEIKHAPDKEHLQEQPDSFGDLPEDIIKQSPSPHLGPDYETNISKLAHPQKPQEQPAAISLNSR